MEILRIKSIKKIDKKSKVFDLSVENNNNFFIGTNGNILTHNCDFLTLPAQASLRNIIETFSSTTRFIMTCNYVERIIDPLQSRCQVIKIVPPTKKDVAKHLVWIMEQEGIKFQLEDLKTIINRYYPDLRKCINTIQLHSSKGELTLDKSILVSTNYINNIIEELKLSKPNFIKIRQHIVDSNVDDFEELFRSLYDKATEYAPGKEGAISILINDHQYKNNFRIDKEINASSLLTNIINLK
jgi:DNA polymerase III delta prime subunit